MKVDEAVNTPYYRASFCERERVDKIPISPEARRDRTLEALQRIVLKGSEIRPIIMAIEDPPIGWIGVPRIPFNICWKSISAAKSIAHLHLQT